MRIGKIQWTTTLLTLGLSVAACDDSLTESPVPMPPTVRYSCNVELINAIQQQTAQANLNTPGGYVLISSKSSNLSANDYVGWGGLLLIQSYEGTYYAFDLACPYCYKNPAGHITRLRMADALTAACPTCDSRFGVLIYGSPAPTAGPANEENLILRQYKATLLADGYTLVVTK
jgi:hypothetical protein